MAKSNSKGFWNFNNPKKQLLVFVLLFALLGGGYYAYKSFAATPTTGGTGVAPASAESGKFKVYMSGHAGTSGRVYIPATNNLKLLSQGTFSKDGNDTYFTNSTNDGVSADLRFAKYVNFGASRFSEPVRNIKLCVTMKNVASGNGLQARVRVILHPNSRQTLTDEQAALGKKAEVDWNIWDLRAKSSTKFETICKTSGAYGAISAILLDTLTVEEGSAQIKDVTVSWTTEQL